MHELALCQSLIATLEAEAARQVFRRVERVTLEIGWLGHVEPDALTFCFDVAARSTLAEGATLVIEREPGRGSCMACGAENEVRSALADCPACGSPRVLVKGGDTMRVKELEVS